MSIFSVGLFRAFRPSLTLNIKKSLTLSSCYRMQFKEVKGDLFGCPESCSLAHCVSEDLKMGKGIATLFLEKFGSVNELKSQKVPVGGVAVLKHDSRLVYYLITKEYYYQKPTYDNFQKSIKAMMQHCQENGVQELAIPRLGCGLDKLDWPKVSEIIKEVFKDTGINITVYSK